MSERNWQTDYLYGKESELKLIRNDNEFLEITETYFTGLKEHTVNYLIKKQELLEDFIYKNLETSILQGMKLKIENELLQRKLKG